MQTYANLVDLVKSFPTSIYLQKSASIQPRTSPSKFGGNFNSIFIRLLIDAAPLQVLQASEEVVENGKNMDLGQEDWSAGKLLEIRITDFQDHVEFIELFGGLRYDEVVEANDRRVLQLRQDSNLPKNALAIYEVLEHAGASLDRHEALRLLVESL